MKLILSVTKLVKDVKEAVPEPNIGLHNQINERSSNINSALSILIKRFGISIQCLPEAQMETTLNIYRLIIKMPIKFILNEDVTIHDAFETGRYYENSVKPKKIIPKLENA